MAQGGILMLGPFLCSVFPAHMFPYVVVGVIFKTQYGRCRGHRTARTPLFFVLPFVVCLFFVHIYSSPHIAWPHLTERPSKACTTEWMELGQCLGGFGRRTVCPPTPPGCAASLGAAIQVRVVNNNHHELPSPSVFSFSRNMLPRTFLSHRSFS